MIFLTTGRSFLVFFLVVAVELLDEFGSFPSSGSEEFGTASAVAFAPLSVLLLQPSSVTASVCPFTLLPRFVCFSLDSIVPLDLALPFSVDHKESTSTIVGHEDFRSIDRSYSHSHASLPFFCLLSAPLCFLL